MNHPSETYTRGNLERETPMSRARKYRPAWITVAAVVLWGCQEPTRLSPAPLMSATTADATPLVPRTIDPRATDPEIDWTPPFNPNCTQPECNYHHVWLDTSQPSNGKLFVFLPGIAAQGPRPRAHQLVPQEAARLGYHVIGLMYQNNIGPGGCAGSADPDCFGNVRLEILDGVDRSGLVNVSPANSIDNRLTKLLLYLDVQYPDEGWSQFLHNGTPKWSQIAVGGHSGGASQTALIGTIRHVDRVVMLSGPANESADAAAWIAIGETPAAKYFTLAHLRDPVAAAIFTIATALELEKFGEPVQVELSQPPYNGTHTLVTDLQPQGGYAGQNPHNSTAVDRFTPIGTDGTPLLRDAWRYMLGEGDSRESEEADKELAL